MLLRVQVPRPTVHANDSRWRQKDKICARPPVMVARISNERWPRQPPRRRVVAPPAGLRVPAAAGPGPEALPVGLPAVRAPLLAAVAAPVVPPVAAGLPPAIAG